MVIIQEWEGLSGALGTLRILRRLKRKTLLPRMNINCLEIVLNGKVLRNFRRFCHISRKIHMFFKSAFQRKVEIEVDRLFNSKQHCLFNLHQFICGTYQRRYFFEGCLFRSLKLRTSLASFNSLISNSWSVQCLLT